MLFIIKKLKHIYGNYKLRIYEGVLNKVVLVAYLFYSFKLLKPIAVLLFGNKIEKRKFIYGLEFVMKDENSKLIYTSIPNFICCSPRYLSNGLVNNNSLTILKETVYLAIIGNGIIRGGSNVVLVKKGKTIYDLKYVNNNNNNKYTDEGLIYENKNVCLVNKNQPKINYKDGICMVGNYSGNYYHLLFEIVVKFEYIEKLKLDIKIPILIDEICLQTPQYLELIKFFNKDRREIIPLKKRDTYLVEKLYYVSNLNFIVPNFKDPKLISKFDAVFNVESINFLRKNLLSLKTQKEYPKRIFLTRIGASDRRKFNEDEILQVLEKYGFESLQAENHSIEEQISIFNNAEIIVGGSGGAFTNLVFCNTNCKVICLTNYKIDISIFSTIAAYLKIDMLYITDGNKDLSDMKGIHESFYIEKNELEGIIKMYI